MAILNRFRKKNTARPDDDEDYRDIASRRLDAVSPRPGQTSQPGNAPLTSSRRPAVAVSRASLAPTSPRATAPTEAEDYRALAQQRLAVPSQQVTPGRALAQPSPTLRPPAPAPASNATGTTRADARPVASANPNDDELAMRREAIALLEKQARGGPPSANNPYGQDPGASGIVEKNRNGAQTSSFTQIGSDGKRGHPSMPDEGTYLRQQADEARRRAAVDEARRRADEDRADGGGMMQSEAERDSGIREDIDRGQQDNRGVGRDEADVDAVTNIRTGTTNEGREDDVTDIARARLDAEQARERNALSSELAANRARDLMELRARAGLSGAGLSGATSAQLGDANRAYDRNDTLAMSNLGRTQRNEGRADRQLAVAEKRADADTAFTAAKRKIVTDEYEDSMGADIDGDGKYAGLTPEEWARRNKLEERQAERDARPRLPDDVDRSAWLDPRGGGDYNERVQGGIDGVDRYVGSDETFDYWIGITGEHFVVRHMGSPYGAASGG